jgi:glutamyl-tRNA reductase
MNLVLAGSSHHRSPALARERLSNCNRTEIHADPAVAAALAGRPFEEHELSDGVYRQRDAAATRHRTLDRAASLARAFDAEVLPLERIGDELRRADVVISSTSAPEFVVARSRWQRPSRRAEGGRCS